MPCYDGREYDDEVKRKEALDKATRLLCGLMQVVEKSESIMVSPELQQWWEEHKKMDLK